MTHRFPWHHWALSALLALSLSLALPKPAHATELPHGVLNYLKQKDPNVKVRFDGLILFSNGASYVPVIPQDPSLNPDPQQVIATQPEKASYPDLIEFDNHYFLIRLIQTSTGRLTFPKMSDYPLQLKEGMLPQDFVLPSNLFIPVELKVILGSLPYNPNYKPVPTEVSSTPASKNPVIQPKVSHPAPTNTKVKPVAATPASVKPKPLPNIVAQPVKKAPKELITAPAPTPSAYIFDLTEQKLFAIDLQTGRKQTDVPLDCVPSSLTMSPDGKLLFAPCLSTNELVIVDTGANLVKTRVAVGQKPDSTLFVNAPPRVLVSNRYSPYLSVVDPISLTEAEKIELPGNGGVMAAFPQKNGKIVVADAFKPLLYVVNLDTKTVEKTIPSLNDISALKVLGDDAGNYEIWMASRTDQKVMSVDATTGTVLVSLAVGQKPVGFASFGERLYVLSAGDSRIDVIDWPKKSLLPSLALDANSFPTGFTTIPSSSKAFITTASGNLLIKLDLAAAQIESQIPVEFRGSLIAVSPNSQWLAQEPTVPASSRVATPMPTPGAEKSSNKVAMPAKPNDSRNKAQKLHAKKSEAPSAATNANSPATEAHSNGNNTYPVQPLAPQTQNEPSTIIPSTATQTKPLKPSELTKKSANGSTGKLAPTEPASKDTASAKSNTAPADSGTKTLKPDPLVEKSTNRPAPPVKASTPTAKGTDPAAKLAPSQQVNKPKSTGKTETDVAMPVDPAFRPDKEEAGNPITPLKDRHSQSGSNQSTAMPASTPDQSSKLPSSEAVSTTQTVYVSPSKQTHSSKPGSTSGSASTMPAKTAPLHE